MNLTEAKHILKSNGYLLNEDVVPDKKAVVSDKKAVSFFSINADIQDIDDWFYDNNWFSKEFSGKPSWFENEVGSSTILLKKAKISIKFLKIILDKWGDNIIDYGVNDELE